jgi:hypothetical protein
MKKFLIALVSVAIIVSLIAMLGCGPTDKTAKNNAVQDIRPGNEFYLQIFKAKYQDEPGWRDIFISFEDEYYTEYHLGWVYYEHHVFRVDKKTNKIFAYYMYKQ